MRKRRRRAGFISTCTSFLASSSGLGDGFSDGVVSAAGGVAGWDFVVVVVGVIDTCVAVEVLFWWRG